MPINGRWPTGGRFRDPSFSQAQRGQLHRVTRHCEICGKPLPAHNGGKTNRCWKHRDVRHGQARLEVVKMPESYVYCNGQLVPDWWISDRVLYRGKGLTGIAIEILAL